MKLVKVREGRCDVCGRPAAYAQPLPGGRRILFCEEHVPAEMTYRAETIDRRDDKRR